MLGTADVGTVDESDRPTVFDSGLGGRRKLEIVFVWKIQRYNFTYESFD
jgi:hypothetical protein